MAVSDELHKAELRSSIRLARRQRLDPAADALGLVAAARAGGLIREGMVVATYIAAVGEPDTAALRDEFRAHGGGVLVPVVAAERVLGWSWDDGRHRMDDVLPVPRPVGEPTFWGAEGLISAAVDLILAPALAVDTEGGRLGQGGGFFDELLEDLPETIPVVAVVHDDEVLPSGAIPMQAHDHRVKAVLTPSRYLLLAI